MANLTFTYEEVPSRSPDQQKRPESRSRKLGLVGGPLLAILLYVVLPGSLSGDGKPAAAVAALMAVWWATEAIAIPATALIPLVLFPSLGGADIEDVASPYASNIIFLFMGGFMLALAIAMVVAVALFIIPGGTGADGSKQRLLDWKTAETLPWGTLLLFGGGLALSGQFTASGLSEWIGEQLSGLGNVPVWVLVLLVVLLVLSMTELTSNTATTATLLPVLGGVAMGLDINTLALIIPCTLAASMAFMLPVATGPNAVVYGSGHVTMKQMIRAGFWLNLVGLILIMATVYALAASVFGIDL